MTFPLARVGVLAAGIALLASVFPAIASAQPAAAPPDPACIAAAHHQDAAHSGVGCGLRTDRPLAVKWRATLAGDAVYPLVAQNRVFVSTANASGNAGLLYALNATTGNTVWGPVPVSGFGQGLTYADGRVYVTNFDGDVTAFAAATGRQLWVAQTRYFSGEPVVSDGVLFMQAAGNVFAIDAKKGTRLWATPQLDGTDGAVSADSTGVYVSAGCSRYRLDRGTGAIVWSGNSGCTGGGGGTTYLANGRVFETTDDYVLNAKTGKLLGSFAGSPAFADGIGYFASGPSLFASDVVTRTPKFSVTLPASAVTSPVVVGSVVYVGLSNGTVAAVDASTGAVATGVTLAATPTADLAVGQGRLVAVSGSTVIGVG